MMLSKACDSQKLISQPKQGNEESIISREVVTTLEESEVREGVQATENNSGSV